MQKRTIIAEKQERISKLCLREISGLSYSVFMNILKNKDVKVNSKKINKDIIINSGDIIDIYISDNLSSGFSIFFQDDNILVVNKKKGYLSESVYEELKESFNEIYFIHRLDRNTDGLMIFALNKVAEGELLNGFKNHTFIKEYMAEVFGKFNKKEDILTAYLVKDSNNSSVKIFEKKVPNSSLIKTGYKVLEEKKESTLVLVRLFTGKTHQIRAHFAHIGNFVLGDSKYGNDEVNKKMKLKTQQLTSFRLTLKFEKESPLYYLNDKVFSL